MSKSIIWAAIFSFAIVGWFASGYLLPTADNGENTTQSVKSEQAKAAAAKPFLVGVRQIEAVERSNIFPVRGITEASNKVDVRARTAGIVEGQQFDTGDRVKSGEIICKLDTGAREAQLKRAQSQLASAERDYDATAKLAKGNFAAKAKVASDKARLELAQAELAQIELDMKWTTITAPIDGVLTSAPAKTGDFLQAGGMCATLHVMDPIRVSAQMPERLLPNVAEGMFARARLITGEEVGGKITSIAMVSDVETRTFKVELEVRNPGLKMRAGLTAELFIELPKTKAHKLPGSALTLSDDGKIGVRIVTADKKVKFMPVSVVSQDADGTWAVGLPDSATVIVEGQDFVVDGQTVETAQSTLETS